MSKEVKPKKRAVKSDVNSYESLKALYFSGKVKPSLNKVIVELEKTPDNMDLLMLSFKSLLRTKNFELLALHADRCIELDPKNPEGHYYKGLALHGTKGKEQEALKNFNEAIILDPDNVQYLHDKAITHFSLYTDYHLPLTFAEKHRVKGEQCLLLIISLIGSKPNPNFLDYFILANVSITIKKNMDAKKYYIKAVNEFENAAVEVQDKNVYKDIIKAQKECLKIIEQNTDFE